MAVYRIAGLCVEMQPRTEFACKLLEAYKCNEQKADISIPPCDGDQEYAWLLEQLSLELLRFDGMYLHGGAVMMDGRVWVFTAPSGTGKSTHLALWKELMGDKVTILNGDKPFIRLENGQFRVYGSPWRGKEGWGVDGSGELAGIYILKRDAENHIEPMKDLDILNMLLSQTVQPEALDGMEKLLKLIGKLMEQIPINALYCNTNIHAARTVLDHIGGLA